MGYEAALAADFCTIVSGQRVSIQKPRRLEQRRPQEQARQPAKIRASATPATSEPEPQRTDLRIAPLQKRAHISDSGDPIKHISDAQVSTFRNCPGVHDRVLPPDCGRLPRTPRRRQLPCLAQVSSEHASFSKGFACHHSRLPYPEIREGRNQRIGPWGAGFPAAT